MPSLFHKRRGSDIPSDTTGVDSSGVLRPKHAPADLSNLSAPAHSSPPPSGGTKLRNFFRSSMSEDTKDDMRRRLSSPSELFKRGPAGESRLDVTTGGMNGNTNENESGTPRSPPRNNIASTSVFPENFSLSQTVSPERSPQARDRTSQQWQPSYPLVIPDDADYGDVPPDGQVNGTMSQLGNAAPISGENEKRRSMDINRSLAQWEPLKPDAPKKSSDTAAGPPVTTSTTSLERSPKPALQVITEKPQTADSEPLIASTAASTGTSRRESEEPLVATPTEASGPPSPGTVPPTPSKSSAPESATTQTGSTPLMSPIPGMIVGPNGKMRPAMPSRRTTLIQSPPMPQPIRNLPTLQGWPGFNQGSGAMTPGWGNQGVPKTPGLPKTPGWGGMIPGSPATPRTPGGFPFAMPAGKEKGKSVSSEEELRKMRRAMPVMLRQASTVPVPDDSGIAGEDDDDEESDGSDTEVEGGGDDDSEPETETETQTSASKGKGKAMSPLDRLKGKGKAKNTKAVSGSPSSSLKISTVREEDETAGSKNGPSLLERRANTSSPTSASATKGKSTEPKWSIGEKPSSGGWFSFSSTPGLTPKTPGTGLQRVLSNEEGYFGSQPSSPQNASVPLASPLEVGLGAPVSAARSDTPPSDHSEGMGEGDDSDDGTNEGSEMTTPPSTNTSLPQSPALAELSNNGERPVPSKRPSLYHQASRSLVDLRRTEDEPVDTLAPDQPALSPITSGEAPKPKNPLLTRLEMPKRQSFVPGAVPGTPGWAKPPPTPATPGGADRVFWANRKDSPAMKRRRSAGDVEAPPPGYEPPHPGVVIPKPREDEGREKLPQYWCAVHIEGMLSRKMEFSAPGVQSRDRSWKKYYCILRGTSLSLYKFDPRRFAPKEGVSAAVGPVPEHDEEEYLHVHIPAEQRRNSVSSGSGLGAGGRRGSIGDTGIAARRASVVTSSPLNPTATDRARSGSVTGSDGRRGSISGSASGSSSSVALSGASGSRRTSFSNPASSSGTSEKDPALFPSNNTARRQSVSTSSTTSSSGGAVSALAHFQTNHLIRQYTLQSAESGLAADYMKRKNVVRIRSEGEQFLLQTEGAREVVDWIEAFQAATNVALDLDDRPMPKIITLPRRRRRRPAPGTAAAGAAGAVATAGAVAPSVADTPEANIRAVEEAERSRRQMDRDMAEDQARQ